jgi:ATP/maltotriose-dependent transcriptional regulator MalT
MDRPGASRGGSPLQRGRLPGACLGQRQPGAAPAHPRRRPARAGMARRSPGEARRRAEAVVAELDQMAAAREPQATNPDVAGSLLLALAELSRLEKQSDPERWRAAAAVWQQLERPFDTAYAQFREAEALLAGRAPRPQAEQVLRSAHRTAVALGAGPLRREIELLAQRGRLRLEEPVDTTASPEAPSSSAASLDLTRREVEVLALVAEGRTNRQIGQALYINPQNRRRPRLKDPGQAGGHRSRGGGRGRPPARPRPAMTPPRPRCFLRVWPRRRQHAK